MLFAHIPRVEAKRTLHELQLRPDVTPTMESVYDLVFATTGSDEQARKAATEHARRVLRSGQKLE